MTDGRIRFSTNILSRLGEELNPNIDQGLIELVKNAYDADALTCIVELDSDNDLHHNVKVTDDGDGMSASEILSGWLVLGSSSKDTKLRTRLGRIPAGNKGLGRLAALRLGTIAKLTTRPRGSTKEFNVTLNWDRFDQVALVDDISIPILEAQRKALESGTEIFITGLRKPITRTEVKRLSRAMILLADPFGDDLSGFKPILRAPEFVDLEKLVTNRYFSDAEYHLTASLRNGQASAQVLDWRGETLFQGDHAEITGRRASRPYRSPDVRFDFWTFVLRSSTFTTRSTSLGEIRTWLDVFGGVHVYSNGLRVAPYGNAGNDWLGMNLSRVRSPEERPSTNNSIGRVLVADPEGVLLQKTDRSGFIDSEEFDELRAFAVDTLEWMARRRLAIAEARRQTTRSTTTATSVASKENLQEQISQAPESVKGGLTSAFARYAADRDREAEALRKEIQLYRTLSTAGITTATFAHESNGGPLKVIEQSIATIERRARQSSGGAYCTHFERPIERVKKATLSLGVLAQATLRLVDRDKRRVGRVELHRSLDQILATFAPFLEGRDVTLLKQLAPGDPYLRGTEAAVESIITNLVNNSLAAFEASKVERRRLSVVTSIEQGAWTLSVSDNGTGIHDISLSDIWLPGETTRPGGTGLGLTIVRDAVSDLGGEVSAIACGELGGATFLVTLPLLGQ